MFGPDKIFSEGDYPSREAGAGRDYVGRVRFAGMVKFLTVAINILELDTNGRVNVTLEESLDGQNWSLVEVLTGSPLTTLGYQVLHTTKNFGALARIRIKVEDSTSTTKINCVLDGRVSGKPF